MLSEPRKSYYEVAEYCWSTTRGRRGRGVGGGRRGTLHFALILEIGLVYTLKGPTLLNLYPKLAHFVQLAKT